MKEEAKETIILVITTILLLGYLIPSTVWMANNPKANKMTMITHISDVMTFKKLEKFQ